MTKKQLLKVLKVLKDGVKQLKASKEDMDSAPWGSEEGVLISGNQALMLIQTIEDHDKKLEEIRQAIEAYRKAEGCSCCRNEDEHTEANLRLGKLLGAKMYSDKSGIDWSKPLRK